jgi:hypothetical protein
MLPRVLLLAALAAGPALPAPAAGPGGGDGARAGALCEAAARRAAARHGVPVRLLRAIALVETGRRAGGAVRPWPWALNIAGRGVWAGSRAEARARATKAIRGGERSVDLGCFQINYRWHGQHFDSIDAMLDPDLGADYAARFLAGLAAEAGDWRIAAGHYHSRTPRHARRYRGLVDRMLARLGGPALATAAPRTAPALPGPRTARPADPAPSPAGGPVLAATLAALPAPSGTSAQRAPGATAGGLRAARPLDLAGRWRDDRARGLPPPRPTGTPGAVRLGGLGRASALLAAPARPLIGPE